ncbi:kinase [Thraustotheca clavata]|uniref:Kinase n=1 Tax=Thraustotheca clavata TaxID=74557 RepID=A0A1V9YSA8_9STRA|nr:kinase [Thraustotheca clavata]
MAFRSSSPPPTAPADRYTIVDTPTTRKIPTITPTKPTRPNAEPAPEPEFQVNWSMYDALAPYRYAYWIHPNAITRIRSINSNYMKTEMANYNGQAVIIRSMQSPKDQKASKQLIAETLSLTRVSHPNIVGFIGFNITADVGLQCICEIVQGKTLRDVLNNPSRASKLTWANEKIGIAIRVASALSCMHSLRPALIHCNIKASKVLLSDGLVPKLSGFGVSRDRTLNEDMTLGIEWCAPELLLSGEIYDEKIDVYSFGVLLTELDTCKLPFANETLKKNELRIKLVTDTLKLKYSSDCPQVIVNIVKRCLQHDPSLRPKSWKLLELLDEAKKEFRQA